MCTESWTVICTHLFVGSLENLDLTQRFYFIELAYVNILSGILMTPKNSKTFCDGTEQIHKYMKQIDCG